MEGFDDEPMRRAPAGPREGLGMPGTAGDDLHSPAQNANARSGPPERKGRVYNLLPKTAWSSALFQITNYCVYCVSRES
ncbi:hypothetical protein F5144DRAFT_584943 [Chaetomium tenue]|uniref:Uncharacterized protein n=1 Tax=Chaetomium tenue TaxID=1854479 RepID=A0ACB7NUT9_9PEZI|nr:hypothetical protein F5144DRAFT_584943 [Chaetomium globosum]